MEEINVVENVVETPVVMPEVVETAETVQKAIESVQIPQINVPMPETKQFMGVDTKTLVDVGVAVGMVGAGVALDRVVPWAVRKIKSGIQTLTAAAKMVKNGGVELNQNPPAQNANTTPNPEPQQNNATPVNQENK